MRYQSTSPYSFIVCWMCLMLAMASCRGDDYVTYMEDSIIGSGESTSPDGDDQQQADGTTAGYAITGMYLLCEGNMGSNKCTLDFLDLNSPDGLLHYQRNIYAERNPDVVKELGDVGNDIQIYGSRLWMVINCSNKVEVCRAADCRRIGQVNIPNCRYVCFNGGYAYVSSYAGPVLLGSTQLGRVYKVDTLSLKVVGTVDVGRQPEEMAVIDGKLYVANSGGYTAGNYERTISVVDLATMTEERRIDVAANLHRVKRDGYGQLWVSSRGDHGVIADNGLPSRLCCIDTRHGDRLEVMDVPTSEMCIVGDTLYFIGVEYSYQTYTNTVTMGLIDVRTHERLQTHIFDAAEIKKMKIPYGIIVNPIHRDFYLFDAKNYVSSGELLHFDAEGRFLWKQKTGDIPSRAVFVKRNVYLD